LFVADRRDSSRPGDGRVIRATATRRHVFGFRTKTIGRALTRHAIFTTALRPITFFQVIEPRRRAVLMAYTVDWQHWHAPGHCRGGSALGRETRAVANGPRDDQRTWSTRRPAVRALREKSVLGGPGTGEPITVPLRSGTEVLCSGTEALRSGTETTRLSWPSTEGILRWNKNRMWNEHSPEERRSEAAACTASELSTRSLLSLYQQRFTIRK